MDTDFWHYHIRLLDQLNKSLRCVYSIFLLEKAKATGKQQHFSFIHLKPVGLVDVFVLLICYDLDRKFITNFDPNFVFSVAN